MKKSRLRMTVFFVALGGALVFEMLPPALYTGLGAPYTALFHRTPVLFFAAVALFAVLCENGRGGLLCRPHRLPSREGWLACILLFAVALNNFPFYALACGDAAVTLVPSALLAYTLTALFTAAAEELLFRGLLFPYLLVRFSRSEDRAEPSSEKEKEGEKEAEKEAEKEKGALLLSVSLSSLLFGCVHLFNLFGGASLPDTLLQIGYSTLIGAAAALLLLLCRSLWVPILFHFVYNFGGLFVGTFGTGELGTPPVILSTAALAVFAAGWAVAALLRLPAENRREIALSSLQNVQKKKKPSAK